MTHVNITASVYFLVSYIAIVF